MLVPRFTWTARADGDLAGDLHAARPGWTWLRQVHGAEVVRARRPGEHAGAMADAAVTNAPGCTVVVRTADCAPIVVLGHRSVAVVHAGWRGLLAGVVARSTDALRDLGDEPLEAHLGPCIRPGCYEFDGPELGQMVDRFGPGVRAGTSWGTPALDLPRAASLALAEADVPVVVDGSGCTACDDRWFSHRARAETGRFATCAWLAEA
ncbi:MAG: polyphenol oxidase family protein [Acidimicrobiales bacterium]